MERLRILIVEDEGLIARDIENMVKSAGYEVCGMVQSGEEAVRQAEALEPDLILMDIILQGGMDWQLAPSFNLGAFASFSLGQYSDISASNGFADQSHFTRWFRRVTGMSPARFRAMVKA